MPEYSDDLIAALIGALVQCDELESNAQLRALFAADDLRQLRDGLPEAHTMRARAAMLVDYLRDLALTDGRSALVAALSTLAARYDPTDARSALLLDLTARTGQYLGAQPPSVQTHRVAQGPRGAIVVPRAGVYEARCTFAESATIGRAASCDFPFVRTSKRIGNWHARLIYRADEQTYWLQDLRSVNGTTIDGEPVIDTAPLTHGAEVRLADRLSLRFEHSRADPFGVGALIYRLPDGVELARYIVAPRGWASFGQSPLHAIPLPYLTSGVAPGGLLSRGATVAFCRSPDDPLPRPLSGTTEISLDGIRVSITVVV